MENVAKMDLVSLLLQIRGAALKMEFHVLMGRVAAQNQFPRATAVGEVDTIVCCQGLRRVGHAQRYVKLALASSALSGGELIAHVGISKAYSIMSAC